VYLLCEVVLGILFYSMSKYWKEKNLRYQLRNFIEITNDRYDVLFPTYSTIRLSFPNLYNVA
jgi:hypothetical protein